MTGVVLDAVLMLLLVAALAYGIRLDRRLRTLREGQLAFAGAVNELNAAAGRAEAALGSLRAASGETDMLHDRILKARAVKQELEILIARAPSLPPLHGEGRSRSDPGGEVRKTESEPSYPTPADASRQPTLPMKGRENEDHERALRMAALAARLQGGEAKPAPAIAPAAVVSAGFPQLRAANQAAQESLSRARRNLDADLFAA
jgi:hypothetical protein